MVQYNNAIFSDISTKVQLYSSCVNRDLNDKIHVFQVVVVYHLSPTFNATETEINIGQ